MLPIHFMEACRQLPTPLPPITEPMKLDLAASVEMGHDIYGRPHFLNISNESRCLADYLCYPWEIRIGTSAPFCGDAAISRKSADFFFYRIKRRLSYPLPVPQTPSRRAVVLP